MGGRGALVEHETCPTSARRRKKRAAPTSFISSSLRGAMNSLKAEIIEDHIRMHVVDPDRERGSRAKGAEELIEIVQAYLK
jgi:Metal-sensitive transcriptional repressor